MSELVDRDGLENRRLLFGVRGFESLSLLAKRFRIPEPFSFLGNAELAGRGFDVFMRRSEQTRKPVRMRLAHVNAAQASAIPLSSKKLKF